MNHKDYASLAAFVLTRRASEKAVLLFISLMADKGCTEFNQLAVERYTRLGHRAVSLACRALKRLGVLDWQRGVGRRPNIYKLDCERMRELVRQTADRF